MLSQWGVTTQCHQIGVLVGGYIKLSTLLNKQVGYLSFTWFSTSLPLTPHFHLPSSKEPLRPSKFWLPVRGGTSGLDFKLACSAFFVQFFCCGCNVWFWILLLFVMAVYGYFRFPVASCRYLLPLICDNGQCPQDGMFLWESHSMLCAFSSFKK